jgi:hypothetical protein
LCIVLLHAQSWTDTLHCGTDTQVAAAAAATAAYRLTPERLSEAVSHLHSAVAAGSSRAAYTLAVLLLSGLAPSPFETITANSSGSGVSHSADVTADVINDVAATVSGSATAGDAAKAIEQCDSSADSSHSCSSSSGSDSISKSNGSDETAAAATTCSANSASAIDSSSGAVQHQQQQQKQHGLGLPHAVGDAVRRASSSDSRGVSYDSAVLDDTATAIGLQHMAAAGGVHEARLALGVR